MHVLNLNPVEKISRDFFRQKNVITFIMQQMGIRLWRKVNFPEKIYDFQKQEKINEIFEKR